MMTKQLLRAGGAFFCFVILVFISLPQPAGAGDKELVESFWKNDYGNITLPSDPSVFSWELLAKAKPDECFYGIGDSRNDFVYPGDLSSCPAPGQPKVNQAYVWGMVKSGDNIWFGTVANTLCQVLDSFAGLGIEIPPTKDWVCEGGGKDSRPPRIFVYNTKSKQLFDMTSTVLDYSADDRERLEKTTGLRSAGAFGNVVFLGGIAGFFGEKGVNIFAFKADTMEYLGSENHPELSNIRQWQVINKQLYVGVGVPGATLPDGRKLSTGQIWRWIGSADKPFLFQTVGVLGADPAYIAEHKGRMFVSTWGAPRSFEGATLYMSPLFGSDQRLGPEDSGGWTIVWNIHNNYEVERAAFYYGGALASYGAYLYWGTMTIPGAGLMLFPLEHPACKLDTVGTITAFLATYRPIHIFRGKDFGKKNQRIELLYGSPKLPKLNDSTCKWEIVPNAAGQVPRFGLAGMNNFFNNYTWWMQRYHGRLFVGTMDFLYVAGSFLDAFGVTIPEEIKNFAHHFSGADLHSFVSLDLPALPVSLNGMGNYLNYGIRTMVADDFLYLGTANPMNLVTEPGQPQGGWELYELRIEDDVYDPGVTE